MTIILFLQRGIENLLEWHAQWLEVLGFSKPQGQWFYALLACLEKPVTPESCSQIRHIVRMCAKIRASLVSIVISFIQPFQCQTDFWQKKKKLGNFISNKYVT